MADVSREVKILFNGDDRVSKVIDSMTGKIDSFAGRVGTMTQPLADATDKILKMEAALAALAAGGLALAFKASTDFETATVSLSKILTDQQQTHIPGIRNEILNLSNTFGQSAVEFLNGATDYKKAGFEIQDVTGLIEGSARLVISGAEATLEMGNATDFLISIMKGFKSPAEDQTRIIDILNKVSNEYATSVTELSEGMATLSPVAKQMGFTYEETASVLTPVIEIFRSGNEAATALRTGLLKLIDDAKPVQDGLAAIGVSQRDANGDLRSGRDILYDVATAFQTVDEDSKLFFASQLVGIRQASKMVEVFNGLTYTNEILATALGATGSAQDEVTKRFETSQIALDRFIQSIVNLGIRMGDEFRTGAKEAIDGASAISVALQDIVAGGAFDELFGAIEEWSSTIGLQLKDIAAIIPEAFADLDWSALIQSIEDLGGEVEDLFQAIFGEIDLTTAEGLTSFVQQLIDGFTTLTGVASAILDSLEPFVEILGDMIEEITSSDESTQEFIGNVLGLGKAINVLSGAVPILTGTLGLLADVFQLILISRIPGVMSGLGSMGGAMTGLLGIMGKLAIAGAAFGTGWAIGTWLSENVPWVDKFGTAVADLALSYKGLDERSISFIENRAAETEKLGQEAVEAVRLGEKLGLIPTEKETEYLVKGTPEYQAEFDRILKQIQDIPAEKKTILKPEINQTEWQNGRDFILREIPGETQADGSKEVVTEITFNPDLSKLDETKKALEEVPSEKIIIARIENETKIEIEKIKAAAETVQKSVEWKAKIEIAEVEELFETMRVQSTSIRDMFAETSEVIGSLTGVFEHLGPLGRSDLMALLEREMANRESLVEQQRLLTEKEIAYLEEKTKRLAEGQGAMINITMDGVYPELEFIMHRIIERTQATATAEGLDFLLGI